MNRLKIGFIGSGFIAQFLAVAMKRVRNVELAAVYKRGGAQKLRAYAQKNGLGPCEVCDSISEVCNRSDAVAILAPNYARVEIMEQIVDAVKAGAGLKGVICEKPLGRTIQEARHLVDLARAVDLPTAYLEDQIYMKTVQNGLDQLEPQQKSMGPFTLVRSAEEHGGPHSNWFWDPLKTGGGALMDMGCHSIAVCQYILTPPGKPLDFLKPVSIMADTSLLKWGQEKYRKQLKERTGVDYAETPAEDYSSGGIVFRNPETDQFVKAQFSNSWMYDKQGLRLRVEGMGPGYAMDANTLRSPLQIFISDSAADVVKDAETALEKSTATRGLLAVQPNEADLYGYIDELIDVRDAFLRGKDAMLNWEFGLQIMRLIQAGYMAAERKTTLDLTDGKVQSELKDYKSLIARGRGTEILHIANS
jgi:predicted dehydrogenase